MADKQNLKEAYAKDAAAVAESAYEAGFNAGFNEGYAAGYTSAKHQMLQKLQETLGK